MEWNEKEIELIKRQCCVCEYWYGVLGCQYTDEGAVDPRPTDNCQLPLMKRE